MKKENLQGKKGTVQETYIVCVSPDWVRDSQVFDADGLQEGLAWMMWISMMKRMNPSGMMPRNRCSSVRFRHIMKRRPARSLRRLKSTP